MGGYLEHFGLARWPFAGASDPAAHYPATSQQMAEKLLVQTLAEPWCFACLTAETGMGKTVTALRLLNLVDAAKATIWISNTHFPDLAALLQSMLFDMELPHAGLKEHELRLAVTERLISNLHEGRQTVLVIDEAQHLKSSHLEELRLLGNLATGDAQALQVVLLGLPDLETTLATPGLEPLVQRLSCRARLEPLDVHEAVDFVVHQLRAAGGRPEAVMTDEALRLIARSAQGVPRQLQRIADRACRIAWSSQEEIVDAEAVVEAVQDLRLALPEEEESGAKHAASVEPPRSNGKSEPNGNGNSNGHGHPPPVRPRRLFGPPKRPGD